MTCFTNHEDTLLADELRVIMNFKITVYQGLKKCNVWKMYGNKNKGYMKLIQAVSKWIK